MSDDLLRASKMALAVLGWMMAGWTVGALTMIVVLTALPFGKEVEITIGTAIIWAGFIAGLCVGVTRFQRIWEDDDMGGRR